MSMETKHPTARASRSIAGAGYEQRDANIPACCSSAFWMAW